MKQLEYADYRGYYARKCSFCDGDGRVVDDGVRKECFCQKKARRKYRLEQIDIYPANLKYKDWVDFTGIITQQDQIVGHLTISSAMTGRDKAFEYCYGVPYNKEIVKSRYNHLKIQDHLHDGQNIVISGDDRTGRSLLGAIICKEVANATVVLNRDLDYRWVKFYDILNAARWVYDQQHHKPVNHHFLDMLAGLDFLFIDGVDLQRGGKNYPADHIAMDALFGSRTMFNFPTILIVSKKILKMLTTSAGQDQLASVFGFEFLQMFRKDDTIIIELVKDG